MRRDVFQAIADPTRREIIHLVAHRTMNLNAVAGQFQQSRPAISKHIKILTECGLLTLKKMGRESYCEAHLDKLNEVSHWVEQYSAFWNGKLDSLEKYLGTPMESNPDRKIIKTKPRTAQYRATKKKLRRK